MRRHVNRHRWQRIRERQYRHELSLLDDATLQRLQLAITRQLGSRKAPEKALYVRCINAEIDSRKQKAGQHA